MRNRKVAHRAVSKLSSAAARNDARFSWTDDPTGSWARTTARETRTRAATKFKIKIIKTKIEKIGPLPFPDAASVEAPGL